jgi:hypothetical protein
MPSRAHLFRTAALAALIALAACSRGGGNNLAELDNSLIGNGADPALTSALEDQILVDRNLAQQSNPNMVRPPEGPVQAQYPADAAPGGASAGAGGQARVRRAAAAVGGEGGGNVAAGACGVPFEYGAQWANRLPAEFPPYPGGRVTEAAGNDRGDCRVRVVTFTTADPANRVLEHYRSLAARGGFTAEQQARGADQVLGGTKGEAAYFVIVTPGRAGSEVALIVNNGR